MKGYIIKKNVDYEAYYDPFLYDAYYPMFARIYLPEEVEGNDRISGTLIPVKWKWQHGRRILIEEK